MQVIVAYSQPRGTYGRYIFTILTYLQHPTEYVEIKALRNQEEYLCVGCGYWSSITVSSPSATSNQEPVRTLELYRYEELEPNDWIELQLHDPDLVFWQQSLIHISDDSKLLMSHYKHRPNHQREVLKDQYFHQDTLIYKVRLVRWDTHKGYIKEGFEEELIEQVMLGEIISPKKISLEQIKYLPEIDRSGIYIEEPKKRQEPSKKKHWWQS